tara:strand:+ start:56 stop:1084 length:1029 start_codon:yes stop_codon:yes gene_type:complete
MLVFATETSCDETSICIMEDKKIIKHLIFSQEIHNKHGGVVPELASREHLNKLQGMSEKILYNSNFQPKKIDVFAATCGPGLIGSLLVGSTFTKSLAVHYNKPFIAINHLEGHIRSTSFNNKIKYPQIILLLTGGHTQMYLMSNEKNIELLGESFDDALGEAFDKVAKMLGLNYPGGPEIEKLAKDGDENFYDLPKPLINNSNFNFSFSGIKTYVNLLIKKNKLDNKFIKNISASFQKAISEIIINKLLTGMEKLNDKNIFIKSISVVGGVANNEYIKKKLENIFDSKKIDIYYPIKEMKNDNAAMIAWACMQNYKVGDNDILFKANPRMSIKKMVSQNCKL